MRYPLRSEAAERVRNIVKLLELHQDQLDCHDRARVDQLLDMSSAWCKERPTIQTLFEVLDNTYEFFEPRTWGHNEIDSFVTSNVAVSFVRSCVAASRYSRSIHIHTHRIFQDDAILLSANEYDYSLVVTAHQTCEPSLYEISVNVND